MTGGQPSGEPLPKPLSDNLLGKEGTDKLVKFLLWVDAGMPGFTYKGKKALVSCMCANMVLLLAGDDGDVVRHAKRDASLCSGVTCRHWLPILVHALMYANFQIRCTSCNVSQNVCHESHTSFVLRFCAICDLQSMPVLEGIHSALNKERTIQMVKAGKQEEDLMSIKIYQATYSGIKGNLCTRGQRPGPDEDVQVGIHILTKA